MATSAPVLLRLVSSSVAIANRAGRIIRDIMSKGELGIVEKVGFAFVRSSVRTYCNVRTYVVTPAPGRS